MKLIIISLILGLGWIGIVHSAAITEIEYYSQTMVQVTIPDKKTPETPKFEATESAISGVGSYYDYVLASGWSSKGHNVCATRDFPRYEMLKVTNVDNGKSVVCKITDYGPDASIHPDRVVDLSSYAFSQIADLRLGVINVKIELITETNDTGSLTTSQN